MTKSAQFSIMDAGDNEGLYLEDGRQEERIARHAVRELCTTKWSEEAERSETPTLHTPRMLKPLEVTSEELQRSPERAGEPEIYSIEDKTGIVYIATDRGLISFKGSATRGGDVYSDVYAYPNPVRPEYKGPIFITGLLTNSQVKVTDLAGNLIYETVAEGGQASWDGNNFSGRRAASGVYLVYLTNDDGSQQLATKLLLIN